MRAEECKHNANREKEIIMKLPKNLGIVLLAIWLILVGLMGFGLSLGSLKPISDILAIAAGVLLLLGR